MHVIQADFEAVWLFWYAVDLRGIHVLYNRTYGPMYGVARVPFGSEVQSFGRNS